MRLYKYTYCLSLIFVLVFVYSCKQSKNVPQGSYLLAKNKVKIIGDDIDSYKVESVLKQEPNHKTLGLKTKLWIYNRIDSVKVQNKRVKKNIRLRRINDKRRAKEERQNKKRMRRALKNNQDYFREKQIELKDTLNPRKFFREWLKYEIGEPPVVYNPELTETSVHQLEIYLKKKGYYHGSVESFVKTKSKSRKVKVTYVLTTGKPYLVDSFYVRCDNPSVLADFNDYKKDHPEAFKTPFIFDTYKLDEQRANMTKYFRNVAKYGFKKNNITYEADTSGNDLSAKLGVIFSDRVLLDPSDPENKITKPFNNYRVGDVYFHFVDTLNVSNNFQNRIDNSKANLLTNGYLSTLDTLLFNIYPSTYDKKKNKYNKADSVRRVAHFFYNEKLPVDPSIVEFSNFLEKGNYYADKYVERSVSFLSKLDLFQSIKPKLVDNPTKGTVDVHYYLVTRKRQSFNIEPRATNSNGYLGVSASINYKNNNLFKGNEKLTVSFSGGFESQPSVFQETLNGEKIETSGRSFNTIEWGPSIKLEVPGIRPFVSYKKLAKRSTPTTIVSAAYNFQKRNDFDRNLLQFNYSFKNRPDKRQVFQLGFPFLSSVQYVLLHKSADFQGRLNKLNDQFLLSTYSNQFIWKDMRFTYEFTNKKVQKGNLLFYFDADIDIAGNLLNALSKNQTPSLDTLTQEQYHTFLDVRYSQFSRVDTELKLYQNFRKNRSLNYKVQLGGGLPYGNNGVSLPFDYSFFSGGANDNRGWTARALGPGTYKYYLDTLRTATQVGDIRFTGSIEYRFPMGELFRGALFVDAGNTWTIEDDPNRAGSKFTKEWYNQLGIATGFGVRVDLDFFIVRLDLGIPIRNPALPNGERWLLQERPTYIQEGKDLFGADYKTKLPNPFVPHFHLGIGYPF